MAFKMSPIGRNKDPYATMAKRGYIAPITQNKTDKEMQSNASLDAENNMASTGEPKVTYSDPVVTYGEDEKGKYKQTDRDKTTTETFKGKGTDKDAWNENRKGVQDRYSSFEEFEKDAQAYRDKMTSKTDHESNREYLPDTNDSSNKKSNELPHKIRADEMTDNRIITGYKENPKYDIRYNSKYNEEQGNGPRKLPVYEDVQAIKGLNSEEIKAKTNSGDKNITVNSLTPDYDRLSESSTKDIQSDLKQNPDNNKTELSDDYSVLEKEYNEKNSPTPQKMFGSETLYKENKSYNDAVKAYDDSTARNDSLMKNNFDEYLKSKTPTYPKMSDHFHAISKDDKKSPAEKMSATRQLMNKHMPKRSMTRQQTKTTYISDNESDKPGKEGWEENKQRYENAKILTNELKSSGKGDKADLDLNLSYQSMMPEVEITPTPQLRGHSIATQCAKSEGGSGCVKKMGSGWKVISNKTGKPWDANYDSEASANAALKAYHAG